MRSEVLAALANLRDDMKNCTAFYFDDNSKDRGAYEALALRVDVIIDLVGQYFVLQDACALNAARWKFAFGTPGIHIEYGQPRQPGNVVTIYRDTVVDGQVIGRKLLAVGRDLPAAVNVFLGLTN